MIYESECQTCGKVHEYVSSVADRANTPKCCKKKTTKILSATQVGAMSFTGHKGFHIPDGKNSGRGTWIESGTDYKRYMKRTGMIPHSEGASEAAHQSKRKKNAEEKKLHDDVVKTVKQATD